MHERCRIDITNADEKGYKDIKSPWQMTSIVSPSDDLSLQYKV